jgi:phage-related holin
MAFQGSDLGSVFTIREFFTISCGVMVKAAQGWIYKFILFPPVVFYTNTLGGNGQILLFFYVAFMLDLICGCILAYKNHKFRSRRLEIWVVKCLVYTLCICLIGAVDRSFVLALRGIQFPLLDLVVSLLLATEATSVFRKLQVLTGKVPPIIMRVSEKMERKAASALEKRLDDEGKEDKS